MFCLLAEDNTLMRGVLHIVMDSENVRYYNFVQGGKEAVEIIRLCLGPLKGADGGIDCIISDVLMPGIYGHMPLWWIRRSEHSPGRFVTVVMISDMVDHRCLRTARDAGVNEFVANPFSPDIIFKRIQRVIENPRQFAHTPTFLGRPGGAAKIMQSRSAASSRIPIAR